MIQTLKQRLYDRFKESRIDTDTVVSVVCVILAISLISAPAVAQVENFSDTFEDGNIDGWNGDNISIDTNSTEGSYSLQALDGTGSVSGFPTWSDGPNIDLSQEFTVQGTSRIVQGDDNARSGFGLVDPQTEEGALLLFSGEFSNTFLATSGSEEYSTELDEIEQDYDNVWVNWELYSSGDGTVQAKVWPVTDPEPSSYQLTRSFDPQSGMFRIWSGTTENNREVYLDSVSIEGTKATDPTLRLDTGNYLGFGETQDYTVFDIEGEREIRRDVTAEATVTSGNTSVITVDQSTNQLTATTDENVSTRVNITANYDGRTDVVEVTVAEQSVENLDVLPFLGRFGAMFLDRGFQMILASLLMSIAATRIGGVFAGLGIYQMGLTAGWLIGWVPIGLAMVGLFSTLFIGLNIAANIDYSVRR